MTTGSTNLADIIELNVARWRNILGLLVGIGALIGGIFATFQTIERATAFELKTNKRIERLEVLITTSLVISCGIATDLKLENAKDYCGTIIKSQGR